MRKSRAGKFKIEYIYIILNFSALDFLVGKIKEREFQKYFCRSLPYFYTITLSCTIQQCGTIILSDKLGVKRVNKISFDLC